MKYHTRPTVPDPCPLCGRRDCPEPSRDDHGAPVIVFIILTLVLAIGLGVAVWTLGSEALDVLKRGAGL